MTKGEMTEREREIVLDKETEKARKSCGKK